jgi:ketosteroid isomerase-like protein
MSKTKLAAVALPILLAGTLSACAKPEAAKPAVDTAKITDTVKADVEALVTALNAKDIDKAVSHDAPNIVGMFHGAPNISSPAEDKALTSQQLKDSAFHLEVSNPTVDVAQAGDMAVYRSNYKATFTDTKTNKQVTEEGNWVAIYKPQSDGSWKVALSMIADAAPAASAAPATPEKK